MNWIHENDKLKKTFTFQSFKEAFAFMAEVAEVAETLNHHPWWANNYNKVYFALSTHDAGDKVTSLDYKLAEAIDKIAAGA